MAKWRFVIARTNIAKWYGGYLPASLRAINEGIAPDTMSFFYIDTPGLFLQRHQDIYMDINYEECKKLGVPVARGVVTGGGAIYAEPGIEPFLLAFWDIRRNPQIPVNPNLFFAPLLSRGADVIGENYNIPIRYRSLNDVELFDPKMRMFRKVMGTGSSTSGNAQLFAWFPTNFKPSETMLKVMASPKDKFADKVLKEVSSRSWNFEEAGTFSDRATRLTRDELVKEWIGMSNEAWKRAFGVEVESEPAEFTEKEMQYVEEFYKIFSSEESLLSRSAEKRFETIPEGTALGKHSVKVTGGPLIRAYVLRRGDTIEDMMFTGTCHMTPTEALEDLEKELKGCKIDENLITTKVEELFAKKNVFIGLGSASLVSDTVIQACKESYKK
jgi:lipoate-protein ligase A